MGIGITHKVNLIITKPVNLQPLFDPPKTAQEILASSSGQDNNQ